MNKIIVFHSSVGVYDLGAQISNFLLDNQIEIIALSHTIRSNIYEEVYSAMIIYKE